MNLFDAETENFLIVSLSRRFVYTNLRGATIRRIANTMSNAKDERTSGIFRVFQTYSTYFRNRRRKIRARRNQRKTTDSILRAATDIRDSECGRNRCFLLRFQIF